MAVLQWLVCCQGPCQKRLRALERFRALRFRRGHYLPTRFAQKRALMRFSRSERNVLARHRKLCVYFRLFCRAKNKNKKKNRKIDIVCTPFVIYCPRMQIPWPGSIPLMRFRYFNTLNPYYVHASIRLETRGHYCARYCCIAFRRTRRRRHRTTVRGVPFWRRNASFLGRFRERFVGFSDRFGHPELGGERLPPR